MTWEVRISHKSVRYISKIEKKKKKLILKKLSEFQENPFIGDIKLIKGRKGTYRRRVGSYRIIYSIDYENYVVKILRIGTRGDIYK